MMLALFLAADGVLAVRWYRYRDEIARLRGNMSDTERQRTDMVLSSEANKVSVMLELIRRQATVDPELHLSISVDSGKMTLERDGALLREMPIEVGGERAVGTPPDTVRIARPRGARSIERVLGASDRWDVPSWVFADRSVPAPPDRKVRGVLGRNAIVLSGGTVIYATPDSGMLADSSYILPGSIRVGRADLRAIAPNLSPGVTVYLYE
ncbi:MAG: L,D-transpeptidase [Gemmatimonadaceae bacterium]